MAETKISFDISGLEETKKSILEALKVIYQVAEKYGIELEIKSVDLPPFGKLECKSE